MEKKSNRKKKILNNKKDTIKEKQEHKKSNKTIMIISIICVLLIIFSILLILNNKKNNSNVTDDNNNDIVDNNNNDIVDDFSVAEEKVVDLEYTDNVEIKDDVKYNNSNQMDDKHYLVRGEEINKNIYVSNIEIYADSKSERCYFKGKIINNSKEALEKISIMVHFYDKNGDFYYANSYFIEKLKSGETQEISFEDVNDFSNAYSVKILY